MKNRKQRDKKITFSPEIDTKITGYALVLTFVSLGLFLLFFPNYFGSVLVSKIMRWLFIIVGVLGFAVEFPKSTTIKGFDDFIIGFIIVGIWVLLFIYVNIWWVNTVSFIILLIGAYGLYQGIIKIVYSVYEDKESDGPKVSSDLVLFLTKLIGLILVILQIAKAINS